MIATQPINEQTAGLVQILVAVLPKVVCVFHFLARLLCSELADRLCGNFDANA